MKRFEREGGVAFYNAEEDEEEKNEQTSPASPSANQSNGGRPVASSASWRGRRTGRILRGTSTSESSLESSRSSNAKSVAGPRYARFSGIAIQMFAIIGIGTFIGVKVDEKYPNKHNLFTVFLSLTSVILAIFIAIRRIIAASKEDENES